MKVLLLGFGKIAYMPYMHFYLNNMKNADFDLIYWDRDGKSDAEIPSKILNAYKYEAYLEEQLPFKKKLRYFYGYRKFALKVLKKNSYDRIIVLHTTPGLTILDVLCRKYKGKYWLDFRDVSYEYIPIYKMLVGKLASNARYTVVSSDAFRKFLPEGIPVYTIHNFLYDSLNHREVRSSLPRQREKLRVSFWGLVRQVEVNQKFMDALGNDSRFELHYYGRMQQDGRDLQRYAEEKAYQNVFFHGSYMPQERYEFASETDLIHNVYNLGHVTQNAMGNKHYDSIIFKIPEVCTEGSHMGDVAEKKHVGISINPDDPQLADELWTYYQQIDWDVFEIDCDKSLDQVIRQQQEVEQLLKKFQSN